ncbi:putative ribonuclease P complex subunit Pop1 [Aspergillus campestris IBT 28561]|uniref:Ribonuclease P complex subunit Pop1 n=1 Tax=Aspergillus campestris (strain IBT 28561) TaxID=1392248 RepID=A0A2I1CWF2_ASPC2|nr:putative ribonuclease P complex subunit Pop1 [Aspergillus campestris IBT 28561]PKY01940.1 putative ribonuclease P complex subunit Pop1 [Aspergillus campestris IBT 28561]
MAPTLPPKRKPDAPGKSSYNDGSAAARKRAKTYDARSLAVQSADAALSASGELDVAAYLEAREFEIRSLESGMQRSKAALTTRAFQQVPRSLRRRTASHNVKRVPSRLRARAKKEMAEDNTPTVSFRRRKPTELMRIRLETARRLQNLNAKTKAKRASAKAQRDSETRKELASTGSHAFDIAPRVPKIKKNKLSRPPAPESKYKKRQRCKTWLPTHMFHAKRAHMATSKDPLWRFALPLSPTEKSYRPSHRARGARALLQSALRAVGVDGDDAWGVKGRKWRAGTRSLRAWVFESGGLQRPIAPVTLVRCAEVNSEDVEMVDAGAEKDAKAKAKKKVFIRVHPSAFLQLWNELLEVSKKQNPPVMVEDLRFEIGSIDITGPGSTEALISALRPLGMDGKQVPMDSVEATWRSLLGVSNPSSLPLNALLGFSISDPRLHFPPQSLKPPSADSNMENLAILLSSWTPDRTQQTPALFDRRARLAAARQLPSQKAINRRRTEAGPGELPTPVESDPRIPVMVLTSRSTTQSKNSNAPGYWTILLPWKCVTPVWYSLMYHPLSSGGNPRFGGLKEQQQLAFEGGEPWFPGDFPGTQAGWEWGLRQREEAKQEWERRPKGRRVEFASLDLGNGQKGEIGRGWACDWEKLLQIARSRGRDQHRKRPPAATTLPLNITQLPPTKATRAIHDPSSTPIDASSLATVRVSLLNRGTPTPRARIYRLPTTNTELRQQWLQLASKPSTNNPSHPTPNNENQENERSRLAASLITPLHPEDTPQQNHLPLPTEEDLIGFVTTGNYNLSEGKGTGIGSILVSRVMRGSENFPAGAKAKKSRAREVNMCIVRAAGETVGRLGRWEVV